MEAAPPSCLLGNELQTVYCSHGSSPPNPSLSGYSLLLFISSDMCLVMCVVEVLVNRN